VNEPGDRVVIAIVTWGTIRIMNSMDWFDGTT
jgi:hypothetical protein